MGTDKKYFIVLFSNKKKRRVLFKSNNLINTKKKYKDYIDKDKPIFPQVFRNKDKVKYDIALVTTLDIPQTNLFHKDSLGRNIKAEFTSGPYTFLELSDYSVEEKIWDIKNNEFIYIDELYRRIKRGGEFKQVFTLNTKIFIQKDNLIIGYSLKNIEDCHRLFSILRKMSLDDGLGNLMYVIDFSTAQRKDLYVLLQKNGFPKESLYRHYSY
tara:strand:- start:13243 stop:13878 length:636 start_codon:yes stop_codon:yes gene_type:complete